MSHLVRLVIIVALGVGPLVVSGPVIAKPKPRKSPIELETGLLPAAAAAREARGRLSVKDRYIVVLKDNAGDPLRVAERLAADGVVPTHVYRHVFNGFAAEIPPGKVAALKRNPDVVSVIPDGIVRATAQTLPTGVDRIDADLNAMANIDGDDARVDVDIAIIDTGVTPHPDLNLYALANCTSSPTTDDKHGHGTAVAGVAAALDNGIGVVGVAPGARIWSVKVLGDDGAGRDSWVTCGIDTVTAVAPGTGGPLGDVEVANASLEGYELVYNSPCEYEVHKPWCNAVAAGVTVVAGAGNSFVNADRSTPASYDEVIAVSALADSDGKAGANGPDLTCCADDTFWLEPPRSDGSQPGSNFGADIDLAAPGVAIRSTVPTSGNACCSDPSGYKKVTGTSFAAPHVAGAAALYIAAHGLVGPAAVKAGLLAEREPVALSGDPDGIAEGIVSVSSPDLTPPNVAIVAPKRGATVRPGATIKLNASDIGGWGVKSVQVRFCKGTTCTFADGKTIGTDTTAPYAVKWKKLPKNGTYTLVAQATDKAGNTRLSDPITIRVKN